MSKVNKVLLLPGDGIGPEVCNEAVKWAKRTKEQCSDLFNETKDICDSNFKNLVERGKNAEKNLHDKILETF